MRRLQILGKASRVTTLLAWIVYAPSGERPELPRGIYVASDSRITWGSDKHRWDAGRKIFSSFKAPHLFGYCGDVVFPSLVLGQIVSAIDQGLLFPSKASAAIKNGAIVDVITTSHRRRKNVPEQDFSILHIYRSHPWPETTYNAWTISYSASLNTWSCSTTALPATTSVLAALGSGAGSVRSHTARWAKSDASGTSRAIFSAFCDSVFSGEDRFSGGVPQVCGLYTVGAPKTFGYVEGSQRYLHGLPVDRSPRLNNIEWFDRLANRNDPMTLAHPPGARKFVRPREQ